MSSTSFTRSREAGGPGSGSAFHIAQPEGRKFIEGIEEPKLLIDAVRRFENVVGISEVIHGAVIIRSVLKNESVRAYGINLDDHLRVSNLLNQIVQGSLNDFRDNPSGALIGREMANRMQLDVGQSFILSTQEQSLRYRVSAIYETGVADIDRVRIYLSMGEVRSLLKRPTGASFLQVSLLDNDRAPQDAWHIQQVLGYRATSWQEREKTWLGVFRGLRITTGITVSVFTLIAGLAMFNTLAMIVLEKTKEIAILRSMGYTREDISRIFIWQAAVVLLIGTILGWLLGAGLTYALSNIPNRIRGIFASDTYIVSWSLWHYAQASLIAVIMVMAASLIPARRAARLEPGDVIRGTAQ